MEYNLSEICMCLFWKFMIKAFFHSVFFCYSKIFRAETFLDLSLRRTCQAIRQKRCRWVKCKVGRHDFEFISRGKCHFIEIKWPYSYLFNSFFFFIFYFENKIITIYNNCTGPLLCLKNTLLELCMENSSVRRFRAEFSGKFLKKNQNEEWLIPNS